MGFAMALLAAGICTRRRQSCRGRSHPGAVLHEAVLRRQCTVQWRPQRPAREAWRPSCEQPGALRRDRGDGDRSAGICSLD